jgi:nitrogen regulatory protein PII
MKRIEAIIKPFKRQDVMDALHEIGVKGLTIVEVMGHGRQMGHREIYRGSEYAVELIPKSMLIAVVPDEMKDQVVKTIIRIANIGKIGDGKIFVTSVEEVYRVRTPDRDEDALGE